MSKAIVRPDGMVVIGSVPWMPSLLPKKGHIVRGWRCALRWTLVVLVCVFTLEGSAWVGYRLLTGKAFSYAAARNEQQRIAAWNGEEQVALAGSGEGELLQLLPHPYVGYVRRPGDPNAVPGQGAILGTQPLQYDPIPGVMTVGIFGGSVAERFSDTGAEALRNALSQHPRFAGKELRFFTAAIGGYKQPQNLLALNYYLSIGQHFDLIVNIDGFNDIAGPPLSNIPKNVSPFFPTGWAYIADRMPDTRMLEKVGAVAHATARRKRRAETMLASPLLSRSVTAQVLWKNFDRRAVAGIAQERKDLLALGEPHAQDASLTTGLPYTYRGERTLLVDLAKHWEQSALLMHELATARGIPFFHFLQPNQYVADSKPFFAEERRLALNSASPFRHWVEEGYPLLQEAGERLRSRGVHFVDLTPLFRGVRQAVYSDDCCHLNADGNAIMAAAVARAITEAMADARHGA